MGNTTSTQVVSDTGIRYEAIFTCVSDGTAETNVRKVDLSDLTYIGTDSPPSSIKIEYVTATVNGFDSVTLAWDRSPSNEVIAVLPSGDTKIRFSKYLVDPKHGQQGSTGDILVTTNGSASSQDSYVIHIRGMLVK